MSQEQILHNQSLNNNLIPPFGVTGFGQTRTQAKNDLLPPFQTANYTSSLSNFANGDLNGKLLESQQKGKENNLQNLLSGVIDLTGTQQVEKSTSTSHAPLEADTRTNFSNPLGGNYRQNGVNGYLHPPQPRNATDLSGYQERSTHNQPYTNQLMKTDNNTKAIKIANYPQNQGLAQENYYQPEISATKERNLTPHQAQQLVQTRQSANIPVQHVMRDSNRDNQYTGVPYQHQQFLTQKQLALIQTASGVRDNTTNTPQMNPQEQYRLLQKHPRSYENHPQDIYTQGQNPLNRVVYPKQAAYQGRPQETRNVYIPQIEPRTQQAYNFRGTVSNPNQPQLSSRNAIPIANRNMVRTEGSLMPQGVLTQQPNHLKRFYSDQIPNARPILNPNEYQQPIPKQIQKTQPQIPMTTPKPTTFTDMTLNVPRGDNHYHNPSVYHHPFNGMYPNDINSSIMENIYINAASTNAKQSYREDEKRRINHIKENLIAFDPNSQPHLVTANHTYPVPDHNILSGRRAEEITYNNSKLDLAAKEIPGNYPVGYLDSQGVGTPIMYTHSNTPATYRDAGSLNSYQQLQYQHKNNESLTNQVVPTTNTSIQSSPSSHKNNDSPGGDLVKRRREEDPIYDDKLNDGCMTFYTP